jgi:thymidylate kinase
VSRPGYVTIEGVDAVGKTTLVEGLREHYKTAGVRIAAKPEFPTSPRIATLIDEALQKSIFIGDGFTGGPAAAFFFMFYAEMSAIAALAPQADLIIGDRGLDSLCLYQGMSVRGRRTFQADEVVRATELLYRSLGLRLPERTLLLTLPVTQLPVRFHKRNRRSPTPEELSQLVWLQEQFLSVAAQLPRFCVLDANTTAALLLREAIATIEQ